MRTAFHDQLDALTNSLSQMCGLAGTAMERATQALLEADLVVAEQVITDHDQLVRMQVHAEEAAFVLLALQAPSQATCESWSGRCKTWPTPSAWADSHCTSPRSRADDIP